MLGVPEEQVPGDLRWCGVDGPRVVGGIGRTFIAAGTLILLFVAYQLWGTGLAEARSQDRLRSDFLDALEAPPSRDQPEPAPPDGTDDPTEAPAAPPPPAAPTGEAVAIMRIPKIGVEKAVVEGVSVPALKHGPGHYPRTPLPGQPGNSAIAGHRTTYGAPFFRLDEVGPGDTIRLVARTGSYRYDIVESKVVRPTDLSVIQPTQNPRLTLTTCTPRFSARQRLIVIAKLIDETSEREAA